MKFYLLIIALLVQLKFYSQNDTIPFIQVLGVAQDGGYPNLGCQKKCCEMAWKDENKKRYVVSLAVVDPKQKNGG